MTAPLVATAVAAGINATAETTTPTTATLVTTERRADLEILTINSPMSLAEPIVPPNQRFITHLSIGYRLGRQARGSGGVRADYRKPATKCQIARSVHHPNGN